jgi:hypothetical protein
MNTIITTPDVKLFVAAVRDHLTDLSEEEREELVGGLEGDMSDLVEERGVEALPEPAEYAAELRSAAGFPEVAARGRTSPRELRGRVTHWLDGRTATWNRWVEHQDHLGLPALAQSLRPVWWVLRALCATALVVEMTGTYVYGFTLNRALLALVAILVSVQIGRGAWWPGNMLSRSLVLRLLVIGLNLFAVVLIPVMAQRLLVTPPWLYADDSSSYNDFSSQSLTFHGNPVRNVYAYDAQGHPLTGVQLVDQDGRRLMVERDPWDDATQQQYRLQPWLNGRTELYSVFPLPEQKIDETTGSPLGEPRLQTPPFASVPPVLLAGVQPSVLLTPAQVEAQRKAAVARTAQAAKAAAARAKAATRAKHRFVSPGQR